MTVSRGGAEAAEHCRAIGVSCARLLSAASATPRETFLPAPLADEAPLRPSRASTRAQPRAPTPVWQRYFKQAQSRRKVRRTPLECCQNIAYAPLVEYPVRGSSQRTRLPLPGSVGIVQHVVT